MEKIESVFLRWPKKLKAGLENYANKRGTSLQTIVTEIVLERFGIQYWRESKGVRDRTSRIEYILSLYSYVTTDLQQVIEEAKFNIRMGGMDRKVVKGKSQDERMKEVEMVGRLWSI